MYGMSKFIFNLSSGQMNDFRNLSQVTGISMAEYLRRYIDNLLNSKEPCGLVISGVIASGYIFMVGR